MFKCALNLFQSLSALTINGFKIFPKNYQLKEIEDDNNSKFSEFCIYLNNLVHINVCIHIRNELWQIIKFRILNKHESPEGQYVLLTSIRNKPIKIFLLLSQNSKLDIAICK